MKTLEEYVYKEDSAEPSIVNDFVENYPCVVDRFFTRFYKIFTDKPGEDHIILFHSNRICLIGLAPSHIAFTKGIESIRFDIGGIDRGNNHVTGKGKKGGMPLQPNSTLAIVKCLDDSVYRIQSCITAKLIQVNKQLNDDINLLSMEGEGYVAIVLPKPENCEVIKDSLFTQTQYEMLRIDQSKMD